MALYQLTTIPNIVFRTSDQMFIPLDNANKDYQDYLAWQASGNTPDPVPTPSAAAAALQQLEQNDALMFRALEVLIDVLLTKGTIAATDFPPALRTAYQARKALRNTAGVP